MKTSFQRRFSTLRSAGVALLLLSPALSFAAAGGQEEEKEHTGSETKREIRGRSPLGDPGPPQGERPRGSLRRVPAGEEVGPDPKGAEGIEGDAEDDAEDEATRGENSSRTEDGAENGGSGTGAKPAPPEKVLLPDAGIYRAPALLRLAGELAGLPVIVARRELNDVPVDIPRHLARRHVSLVELRIVLAAQSLFLIEWTHPQHGRMLVASDRPDWKPPRREVRRTIRVPGRWFETIYSAIEDEIEKRNRLLPESSQTFYAALPLWRQRKILLAGPTASGLGEIIRAVEGELETREKERAKIDIYRPHHRRAPALYQDLTENLGRAELERARVRVGSWQNVLLFQGDDDLREKIRGILERFDTRGERDSGRQANPREPLPDPTTTPQLKAVPESAERIR